MVVLYNLILIILSLLLLPVIFVAFIIQPKFRAGFWQKIGFYKFNDKKFEGSVVFHAVSVGEVNAVKSLVKEYKYKHPEKNIIITTTTKTGQEIAKKAFSEVAQHITYFPYDYFFSVLSFFNTYKPEKIIIAETEIWPCFVTLAKLNKIKVYIVNGRISPKSFKGYKKIKMFLAPILNKYEKIFMQSNDDAERMIEMGADSNKVEVMGNLKFDITTNLTSEEIEDYKNQLKTTNYRVFIAASTHKGEDEIVLNAFKELKSKEPDSKLLIAPRHPQRYDEVAELLEKTGFNWGKRSCSDNFDDNDIIMLDTMGELAKLFSICYTAFIGGSFSQTGGHNPLEANVWSKPVISGPCVFNFKDVYKIVTDKKCAVIVNDSSELTKELVSLYADKEKYDTCAKNAKAVFEENKGAINYVLAKV